MGFGLRFTFTGFSITKGSFAAALGFQDRRGFFAFGAQNYCLLIAFGLQNFGTFLAFRHHLLIHRPDQICRQCQILDFDTCHLQTPRVGRRIHRPQQPGVDVVTLGEHIIERH